MPGPLHYPPSRIVLEYLVTEGYGTDPDDDDEPEWPIYMTRHPDRPDNLILLTDTEGISNGDTQTDGERQDQDGLQIMVKAAHDEDAYRKIRQITVHLDSVARAVSLVPALSTGTGSDFYEFIIHGMQRTSGILGLGVDVPQGKRFVYSTNYLCMIRQCCN